MSGEKSFAPTEKRKRDAAQKGDILRSREVATAVAVLVGAAWLALAGPWMLDAMANAARIGLTWDRAMLENFSPGRILLTMAIAVLPPLLVLAAGVMLAVIAVQLASADGRWVGANLAPKGSRINPLSGLKRMFGPQGWIEVLKGIGKVALLGALGYFWARSHLAELLGLGRGITLNGQLVVAWDAVISLMFLLAGGLVVIAMIDWPIQWLRRMLRLRMSHQEMRDEHKESEGSPKRKPRSASASASSRPARWPRRCARRSSC